MERYLITTNYQEPFLTHWFDAENHFNSAVDMVVYDLINNQYTKDGINWQYIQIDNL